LTQILTSDGLGVATGEKGGENPASGWPTSLANKNKKTGKRITSGGKQKTRQKNLDADRDGEERRKHSPGWYRRWGGILDQFWSEDKRGGKSTVGSHAGGAQDGMFSARGEEPESWEARRITGRPVLRKHKCLKGERRVAVENQPLGGAGPSFPSFRKHNHHRSREEEHETRRQ